MLKQNISTVTYCIGLYMSAYYDLGCTKVDPSFFLNPNTIEYPEN